MRRGLLGIGLVLVACSTPYGVAESEEDVDGRSGTSTSSTEPVPDASKIVPKAACPALVPPKVSAWKTPPAPAPTPPCAAADLSSLAQSVADKGFAGAEALMLARNAACAKCVFSRLEDPYWRAVVRSDDTSGGTLNEAACFARATGGSDTCGRSEGRLSACVRSVCTRDACGSDAAVSACRDTDATTRACAPFDTTAKDCGGIETYRTLEKRCRSLANVAAVLCGELSR